MVLFRQDIELKVKELKGTGQNYLNFAPLLKFGYNTHMIVYTIGTSNRTIEEFMEILALHQINAIIDVRRFPTSQRFEHFKKEKLAQHLHHHKISYHYLGNLLGGFRKGGYEAYMETGDFLKGIEQLKEIAKKVPSAFMCAEKFPWKCHRNFIASSLKERGWEVIHILDMKETLIHATQKRLF
jgi:uncharacterized protein (DUF488 family)